jgi:hypothetical protein
MRFIVSSVDDDKKNCASAHADPFLPPDHQLVSDRIGLSLIGPRRDSVNRALMNTRVGERSLVEYGHTIETRQTFLDQDKQASN